MKKILTTGLLSLLLLGGFASVQANEKMMKDPAKMQEHMDDKMEKMTKELNLNSDQQATIKSAMQTKMDKMKSAEDEFHSTVRSTLNADQAAKYDKMMMKK